MASFLRVLLLALFHVVEYSLQDPLVVQGPPPAVHNNLTINVDDLLKELYLDGVPVPSLPNADEWFIADNIPLPDSTKVIAVLGQNNVREAVLVASDLGGWVLSDRLWRYSTVYFPNWTDVDFDDSAWDRSYVVRERNDGCKWNYRFPRVSRHASLIWSPKFDNFTTNDNMLYFRLRIKRDLLRRNFDAIASDKMVRKIPDCFRSRRIRCASSCSQMTSLCAGFQHHKDSDTCCLLTAAELEYGTRQAAVGWKIWSSIVLYE